MAEKEVREEVVQEVIESTKRHIKTYGFRSRSVEGMRKIIE